MSEHLRSFEHHPLKAVPVPRSCYPSTFQHSPLALAVVDLAGRIQEVNPAFLREIGVTCDDVVGATLDDLWCLAPTHWREAEQRMATDGVHFVDVPPAVARPHTPESTLQFLPLFDGDGARAGSAVSAISLSTRRRLRQRSIDPDGFELSFDQLAVGMLITGIDGYVTRCNAAMQRLLGRTTAEIATSDVVSMIHPDHRRIAVERGWAVLSGGTDDYSYDTRLLRGDGSAVWVHESTTCVRDANGQPLHFASQFVDIDDRKRAEAERDRALTELTTALEALRQSESKFKFLVQGTPVPLIELDEKMRISSANAALTDLLGRDPIGLPITEVIAEADLRLVTDQLGADQGATDRPGPDLVMEVRVVRVDGVECWVRAHSRIRRDDEGTFVSATATWTDITESRREADELRRQASTDELTGLPNRATLLTRLGEAIAAATAPDGVAVLFVDLDHFKPINDRWGHEAGDELLRHVAQRMRSCVRQHETVARFGGDEFIILADAHRNGWAAVERVGHRVVDLLAKPFTLDFGTVAISASAGLAFGGPGSDPRELVHRADIAAYQAKWAGRSRLKVSPPP
jgi:diguanylate cyclase (GGDEF)-like protein/PAS domain S-box-containing protein